MKIYRIIAATAIALATLSANADCGLGESCPLDGANSVQVGTEFSGMVKIGIYEHHLTTGGVHRFRVRCN